MQTTQTTRNNNALNSMPSNLSVVASWKDELQPLRVESDLNRQCAEHLAIDLNGGVNVAFHPHPVGYLNSHPRSETDKATSECRKLPQSHDRPASHSSEARTGPKGTLDI